MPVILDSFMFANPATLLDGLWHLGRHKRGIVHCNLKSPNLLLDAGWRVKLTGKCLAGLLSCNRSVAPSVIIVTLSYLLSLLLSVPCRLLDAELHASGGPQKRQPTMAGAVASAFSFAYLFSGCPVGLRSARLWSGLRGYATLPFRRAPTNSGRGVCRPLSC